MKIKKFLSFALCSVMLCGIFSGCGNSKTEISTAEEGNGTQTLTMAVGTELNTLYPLNMDEQNNVATKLCYEGLVNYVDGEVVPCLAEDWKFSDDGKDLTFYLKEGVTFHDGTPFNAEAVQKDFDYARGNSNFSGIAAVANLQSVEAVDEYTVTFHYPSAYFAYLMDFCCPEVMILVSPEVLEEGNYQSMKGVVGTGPYIYQEIVDGEYVKFVRNENYWGEQPYYDEVIVKYIPEASARLQALQNGEIDMIYGSALLTWDDYDQATSLSGIEGLVAETDSETRNLVLNASGVLSDIQLREAIAYAIDKQAISDGLIYGNESVADALFSDGIPYTDVELNVVRGYDLEKANSLLDEAGWTMDGTTGLRQKDGKTLTLKYTYDSGEAMNKPIATAIKSQLAQIGIDVQTEGQEMMAWWQEGLAGNYDITMWDTEQPYTSPQNFFIPMVDRSPHSPSLEGIEGGSEFKSLIVEFQSLNDSQRVQDIFTELLNFDNDNVLDLPLLYSKDMIVYNSEKISGYTFTSTSMFFDIRNLQPAE